MTDHEPDKMLMCRVYLGAMGLGLSIFALGVYVGTMI